jgi:hypothetical protein
VGKSISKFFNSENNPRIAIISVDDRIDNCTNIRGITLDKLIILILLLGIGSFFYIMYAEAQRKIARGKALDQIIEFVLNSSADRPATVPKDKSA